jgi:sulfatase maturation enzyme AslB (radical SAM superfamily)
MEYYNSTQMKNLRTSMLTDVRVKGCRSCQYEDSFGKDSGRMKQLFRSNLDNKTFDQDYPESPHFPMFKYSENNDGLSDGHPYDLQVNLSNTCNSACIMCHPEASSRLYQDYKKLSKVNPILFRPAPDMECWADDPVAVEKFIQELKSLPSISYLHLLGGETLYLESFYTICEALIESGLSKNIYLGTTTNLTVYSQRLENIVSNFKAFHIGLSIESVNPLNDYIRYPSNINSVLSILDKFISLRERVPTIHLSLRITPNIFSIYYIDEVIQYLCDHRVTAESCDILTRPLSLRMELLPDNLKHIIISKLQAAINKNSLTRGLATDSRNPLNVFVVISSVAFTYLDFLQNMKEPDECEKYRFELVSFINGFESIRHNSILDYAPDYEPFLTKYGYKKVWYAQK